MERAASRLSALTRRVMARLPSPQPRVDRYSAARPANRPSHVRAISSVGGGSTTRMPARQHDLAISAQTTGPRIATRGGDFTDPRPNTSWRVCLERSGGSQRAAADCGTCASTLRGESPSRFAKWNHSARRWQPANAGPVRPSAAVDGWRWTRSAGGLGALQRISTRGAVLVPLGYAPHG
jgi:hypothetical protein